MTGADTGFFFALREGHPRAARVFDEEEIAASVLTKFELRRIALRRGLPWGDIGPLLEKSLSLIDITCDIAEEASRISHGTGMPAVDALILASLISAGCRTVYTRDEHLLRFARGGLEIVRI